MKELNIFVWKETFVLPFMSKCYEHFMSSMEEQWTVKVSNLYHLVAFSNKWVMMMNVNIDEMIGLVVHYINKRNVVHSGSRNRSQSWFGQTETFVYVEIFPVFDQEMVWRKFWGWRTCRVAKVINTNAQNVLNQNNNLFLKRNNLRIIWWQSFLHWE